MLGDQEWATLPLLSSGQAPVFNSWVWNRHWLGKGIGVFLNVRATLPASLMDQLTGIVALLLYDCTLAMLEGGDGDLLSALVRSRRNKVPPPWKLHGNDCVLKGDQMVAVRGLERSRGLVLGCQKALDSSWE